MENNVESKIENSMSSLSGRKIYDNANVPVKYLSRLIVGAVVFILILMFVL